MNITIKETSEIVVLSIIDPKTGTEYITDFIGNSGAMNDGQFTWDEKRDTYACSQDTFNWWDKVVTSNQLLEDRIHDLAQKHGLETVYGVVHTADSNDLEDHAANVNQALDEAFGSAEDAWQPSRMGV